MSRASEVLKSMDHTVERIAAAYEKRHGESPRRKAWQSHEAVDRDTPADALMRKEDELGIHEPGELPVFEKTLPLFGFMNGEHPTIFEDLASREAEVMDKDGREGVLLMLESHFWLLDFLFADGPHPGVVMRRLYAWVKKYRPAAIWEAGYRQLGDLLGESHGTMEWRIGALIDDYAAAKGLKGVKMPWQRGADVSAKLSAAQRGNCNRVGGNKHAAGTKQKHKARKTK